MVFKNANSGVERLLKQCNAATQDRGPGFGSQEPMSERTVAVYACNPTVEEAKTAGFLELLDSQSS